MTVATLRRAVPKPRKQDASVLDGGLSPGVMEEMKQNGAKLLPPKKRRSKTDGQKQGVWCKIYQGKEKLTAEEAIKLIGWEIVESGEFTLNDAHGNKVRLTNNSTNRPWRPGVMKRYLLEVLRAKWSLNGETIIIDWDGDVQSGQHRLVAIIMAEQLRRKDPEKWKKYWKGPIAVETIVVFGIDPAPEVVNTIDQGQRRTIGDVFFRSEMFGGGTKPPAYSLGEGKNAQEITLPVMGAKLRQKLCNVAAGAARLAWQRAGGKTISDAPQFPVSEAVDFIKANPGLLYCVAFINALDGGDGKNGEKIYRFTKSVGVAAGLMYLMATSGTDFDEWKEQGGAALDFKMVKKAKEFWSKFASGAELKADDPVFVLRELLPTIDGGSAVGREEKIATIVKAFNAFVDGKKCKTRDLTIAKRRDDYGKEKLADDPHLGGLDIEGQEKPEPEPGSDVFNPEAGDQDREGSKSKKKWSEGDTCWVKHNADDGGNYFGTIKEVIECEDGKHEAVVEADDGNTWQEPISLLSLKYPG